MSRRSKLRIHQLTCSIFVQVELSMKDILVLATKSSFEINVPLTWKIRFCPGTAASTISSKLQLAFEEIYPRQKTASPSVT